MDTERHRRDGVTLAGDAAGRISVPAVRICLAFGAILLISGCSADPDAPVNQLFPIKQMDDFFRPYTGSPAPRTEAVHPPGYAPAYPPYPPP